VPGNGTQHAPSQHSNIVQHMGVMEAVAGAVQVMMSAGVLQQQVASG
jgi:hypothetical protein